MSGGSIPDSRLVRITRQLNTAEKKTTRLILQDHQTSAGPRWSYLHYSFYEYLVAEYFVSQLLKAYHLADQESAIALLRRDMPKQMRRFAVRLLRRLPDAETAAFFDFLANMYRALRKNQESQEILTACNLISYFLGRIISPATTITVRRLLESEENKFLRTSLYWAACYANDVDLCAEYCSILSDDDLMRQLNRGYLLYYLERFGELPYLDNDPTISWAGTRQKMLVMMSDSDYSGTADCRKLIDVLTFLDFIDFRKDKLKEKEFDILCNLIGSIGLAGVPEKYKHDALKRLLEYQAYIGSNRK
jgi:hypothetical protein